MSFSKEQLGCLGSLDFENGSDQIPPPVERECEWLFVDRRFENWLRGSPRFLFFKGGREAKTSTLMKYASQRIQHRALIDTAVASVFVHDDRFGALGLFRSLCHQFSSHIPGISSSLTQEHGKRAILGDSETTCEWQTKELQTILSRCIPEFTEDYDLFIIIDGVGKLGRKEASKIIRFFAKLHSHAGAGFRICFSSEKRLRFRATSFVWRSFFWGVNDDDEDSSEDGSTDDDSSVSESNSDEEDGSTDDDSSVSESNNNEEDTREGNSVNDDAVIALVETLDRFHKKSQNFGKRQEEIRDKRQETILSHYEAMNAYNEKPPEYYEAAGLAEREEVRHSLRKHLAAIWSDTIPFTEDSQRTLKLFQWLAFTEKPLPLEHLRYALLLDASSTYGSIDENLIQTMDEVEAAIKDSGYGYIDVHKKDRGRIASIGVNYLRSWLIAEGFQILERKVFGSERADENAKNALSTPEYRFFADSIPPLHLLHLVGIH